MAKPLKPLDSVTLSSDEQAALDTLRGAPVHKTGSTIASFFVIEKGDAVQNLLRRLAKEGVISFQAISGINEPKVTNAADEIVEESFAAGLAITDMHILGIREARDLQPSQGMGHSAE